LVRVESCVSVKPPFNTGHASCRERERECVCEKDRVCQCV